MIRVALLSYWHFHTDKYIRQARELADQLEIVVSWDSDPDRGRAAAARYGLDFEQDLDAVLGREDIDAVIVQTPTSEHREVIAAAARAGKHIFSDKVLASTIADAAAIARAVEAAGVVLVVGMPQLYHDYVRRTQELIASGRLGRIVNVRMMNCHGMAIDGTLPEGFFSPEEAEGGALIDMCHMVYITPRLLGGLPSTAYATFGTFTQDRVDDSALAVFTFPDGSHASLEAGFVTRGAPRFELEVNGTEGTLQFQADSHPGGAGAPAGSRFHARFGAEAGFTPLPLGEGLPTPMEQWVQHVERGEQATDNVLAALDLSRMIEAAYLSAAERRVVALDSLVE
jgi:predicted dehydrogenase